MIASLVYTFMFLFFGVTAVRFLLPRHRPLNRLWLGLSLGLLEEMWLPAIGAFLFSFDVHFERSPEDGVEKSFSFIEKGGEILPCMNPIPRVFLFSNLSAETQLLDKCPVSLDVHLLKVVQKLTALTDQAEKGTTGGYVLLVLLLVLGKVSDTVGK